MRLKAHFLDRILQISRVSARKGIKSSRTQVTFTVSSQRKRDRRKLGRRAVVFSGRNFQLPSDCNLYSIPALLSGKVSLTEFDKNSIANPQVKLLFNPGSDF